jgi:hypothetical protein
MHQLTERLRLLTPFHISACPSVDTSQKCALLALFGMSGDYAPLHPHLFAELSDLYGCDTPIVRVGAGLYSAPASEPSPSSHHSDSAVASQPGGERQSLLKKGVSFAPMGVSLAPTKMMRGRSYSSGATPDPTSPAPGPTTVDLCFSDAYLTTPLLLNNATANAAQHLFGTPPPRLSLSFDHIDLFVPAPTKEAPHAKKKVSRAAREREAEA